ncbi:OST-HTH/LOTUS domain-containing protein [Methanofollis formosanus]|nr:OST-HTH/LOTUS domain-containing protein [Methanofollis formosanus]
MGRDLLIRYLKNRPSDEPILLAQLKPLLVRLQPSFSEKQLGFRSFKDFITSMKGDVVKSIEPDPRTGHHRVIFSDLDEIHQSACDERSEICGFLTKNLRYQNDPAVRKKLSEILYAYLQEHSPATIHEMVDYIAGHSSFGLPKIAIRRFVFPLGEDRVFHYADKDYSGSLVDRPQVMNDFIHSADDIERVYVERIRTIMKNKFSDIEDDLLDSLL